MVYVALVTDGETYWLQHNGKAVCPSNDVTVCIEFANAKGWLIGCDGGPCQAV